MRARVVGKAGKVDKPTGERWRTEGFDILVRPDPPHPQNPDYPTALPSTWRARIVFPGGHEGIYEPGPDTSAAMTAWKAVEELLKTLQSGKTYAERTGQAA